MNKQKLFIIVIMCFTIVLLTFIIVIQHNAMDKMQNMLDEEFDKDRNEWIEVPCDTVNKDTVVFIATSINKQVVIKFKDKQNKMVTHVCFY